MTKQQYQAIERYMQQCMNNSAHDKVHAYRVLCMIL